MKADTKQIEKTRKSLMKLWEELGNLLNREEQASVRPKEEDFFNTTSKNEYFFNMEDLEVNILPPGWGIAVSCDKKHADVYLKVSEKDFPYLEKPEGNWEFRKVEEGDRFLGYSTKSIQLIADDGEVIYAVSEQLHGYRWCRPKSVVDVKDKPSSKAPEKPPIGLKPANIFIIGRCRKIMDAMDRYMAEGKEIPEEWIQELQDRLHELKEATYAK